MVEYEQQGTVPQIENKRNELSKKIWNIENTKLKEVNSDGKGRIDYRLVKGMDNGTNFIFFDNEHNKSYVAGKINNRFYNLSTGDEIE